MARVRALTDIEIGPIKIKAGQFATMPDDLAATLSKPGGCCILAPEEPVPAEQLVPPIAPTQTVPVVSPMVTADTPPPATTPTAKTAKAKPTTPA
jgi:hypothetical protein